MIVEEKRSPWRYLTPTLAAVLVAGSVAYFNLTLREYPYIVGWWDYGWPQLYRQKGYDIWRGGITSDEISYGALWANIATGAVLAAVAAWGGLHLQKINRSLFRVHLQTILFLVLTIGTFMLLNSRVREFIGVTNEIRVYGWPHDALTSWKEKDQQGAWPVCWLNVAKNAFVALYTLFLVTLASESWLAWRTRKKSNQPPT